ncbi:hypothetical protein TraAM80_05355 [Trypanosoma rangeli]|uniref:Uncharacterized protein n=1 Tax=Trypanosoma rangeli TaxID=5698 RepID=A0A3R7LVK8_TRYRA|nr:uncharacterized protein TraAM80_05355 [Trypanosoma rangeli]RNF04120.1 hypothetical protein TraAM80_05355 [Trypanosoma rangeli]|eukprot:RNF04120.1 hypothetical protein TraAM80_05355 [Trypanosoma rangeli]
MNSLGDRFRCVVVLLRGQAGDDDGTTSVYRVATIVPAMGVAPLEEEVAASIIAFAEAHEMKIVDWGSDATALLTAARRAPLAHISLLRADAATFAGTRQQLLAQRDPTLLLLELACDRAVPSATEVLSRDEWSWIRPPPSCFAELTESERRTAIYIPVAMRCSAPLVRATASQLPLSLWRGTAVTLKGVLREVGYKVGCLPKYGS